MTQAFASVRDILASGTGNLACAGLPFVSGHRQDHSLRISLSVAQAFLPVAQAILPVQVCLCLRPQAGSFLKDQFASGTGIPASGTGNLACAGLFRSSVIDSRGTAYD